MFSLSLSSKYSGFSIINSADTLLFRSVFFSFSAYQIEKWESHYTVIRATFEIYYMVSF